MGEALTRLTIWIALAAYFVVTASALSGPRQGRKRNWQAFVWLGGCAAYLLHVISAFHFYHGWSHDAALAHTTAVTQSMTGWKSGVGLYVNYAFTLTWLGDAIWWWMDPGSHARRPRWVSAACHSFLLFMVFNGTVVFGKGIVRYFGAFGVLMLTAVFLQRKRPAAGKVG